MKNILFAMLVVLLVSSLALGQETSSSWKSFRVSNSTSDTTKVSEVDTSKAFRVGPAPFVAIKYTFTDRFSVAKVVIQTKADGDATWASQTDTLAAWNATGDGTTRRYEKMLRGPGLDYIDHVGGYVRLINTFAGSGNDTAKYYMDVLYGGN